LAAGIVLFVGWETYVQLSGRRALLDDLCPAQGEDSLTVVLVDLTDPLSVAQKQDLTNQLERIRNGVPKYGRITLYKVAATDKDLLRPVLDLCNPGDGSDVSEGTGNPKAVHERWEKKFSAPLDRAFEQLTHESGADRSPIFQSVQSVALTKLQRPEAAGKPKKLVLVSDLLQNAGGLDFYRHIPTWDELQRDDDYQRSKADLHGVDMELWMLSRPGLARLQNTSLAQLWAQAFNDQGARVTYAYNING
jgi:hypothetical protein